MYPQLHPVYLQTRVVCPQIQCTQGHMLCTYRLASTACLTTKRTCEANVAGENSSFIFTVCVKAVACYHFKLAMKFFISLPKHFSKPTSESGEIGRFNRSLLTESF